MRALLIGAVEGTRVAMESIAAAPGWELGGLLTLPPALAARHSDFVDLAPRAHALGATVIHSASGNDPAALAAVAALAPDLAFVIGWSSLCGPDLVRAAGGRMVGYHPAALPRLRGRAPIPWTILLDERITASTLFWIAQGTDDGPILAQRFFHVAPDETAGSLYAKHMDALRLALDDLLSRLGDALPPGVPQDERLATWGTRRRAEDGLIDWTWPADAIDRLVRAVGRPYPGAFTTMGDRTIRIWSCRPAEEAGRIHAMPGQVIAVAGEGFTVFCGDGRALRIDDHHDSDGRPPRLHAVLGRSAR